MAKSSSSSPSFSSKILVILLIIVGSGLVLSLGATAFGAFGSLGDKLKIEKGSIQAVHLADGSVMFGNLSVIDPNNLSLTDVYTVQDSSEEQKVNETTLVSHESKPYGPSGSVVINRDQVLFWENLADTGLVTETIKANDSVEQTKTKNSSLLKDTALVAFR